MMSELTIKMRADTSELEEKEAQWKLRLRTLNNEINKTRTEIKRTTVYAAVVVGAVMSILNAVVSTLPEPLRLVGTAAVSAINSVVQAIIATAMAFTAAGAANPVMMVQAFIAWVGVEIAMFGLAATIASQQRLDSDIGRLQGQMSQVASGFQNILGALGGY